MASAAAVPSAALRERTKQFAYRIVKLFRALPKTAEAQIIGRQLLRCGTSVGANYRAVCLSRSHAEFIARIGIVLEEADESVFWLELIGDTGIVSRKRIVDLLREAEELTLIFGASQRTARGRK
jgi:four helix bundle protein